MSATPRPTLKQYWDLTKPRVVALIVFTAFVGMFLAVPGWPPLRQSLLGFLGIWLAAASAAAINQLLDARIDAKMARTSWRPIVAGQVTPTQALVFALILAALSMLTGSPTADSIMRVSSTGPHPRFGAKISRPLSSTRPGRLMPRPSHNTEGCARRRPSVTSARS